MKKKTLEDIIEDCIEQVPMVSHSHLAQTVINVPKLKEAIRQFALDNWVPEERLALEEDIPASLVCNAITTGWSVCRDEMIERIKG